MLDYLSGLGHSTMVALICDHIFSCLVKLNSARVAERAISAYLP